MAAGLIGQIVTPAAGNRIVDGARWCVDNGVFASKYPGDEAYLRWLAARADHATRCQFVVAPDVLFDAAATLTRSGPMLARIRALGFPVALVAQNGLEDLAVPWDDFDCLFIGGDTDWKLGAAAYRLIAEARRRGKWVHMGRVNSRRRLRYAHHSDCDSVDGTYLAFGPDVNLVKVKRWVREIEEQPCLPIDWTVA